MRSCKNALSGCHPAALSWFFIPSNFQVKFLFNSHFPVNLTTKQPNNKMDLNFKFFKLNATRSPFSHFVYECLLHINNAKWYVFFRKYYPVKLWIHTTSILSSLYFCHMIIVIIMHTRSPAANKILKRKQGSAKHSYSQ